MNFGKNYATLISPPLSVFAQIFCNSVTGPFVIINLLKINTLKSYKPVFRFVTRGFEKCNRVPGFAVVTKKM
jgi:hypothetical protein